MPGRFDISSRIVSQKEIAPDTFLLRLYAPEIAENAVPGQFVMVRPGLEEERDPLLRRPFSVHRADPDAQQIEILYRVVGRGTRMIARKQAGSHLQVLGPLGRGFSLPKGKIPILVGGGLGTAPLLFLADVLEEKRAVVVLGAVTRSQLLRLQDFSSTGLEVLVATEDGSLGNRGLVTEVLDRLLGRLEKDARKNVVVFSCGPMPMMRAVAGLCGNYSVECQVSLETAMACGLGLCLGCAVCSDTGAFLHVCRQGPVFPAGQVDWSKI